MIIRSRVARPVAARSPPQGRGARGKRQQAGKEGQAGRQTEVGEADDDSLARWFVVGGYGQSLCRLVEAEGPDGPVVWELMREHEGEHEGGNGNGEVEERLRLLVGLVEAPLGLDVSAGTDRNALRCQKAAIGLLYATVLHSDRAIDILQVPTP